MGPGVSPVQIVSEESGVHLCEDDGEVRVSLTKEPLFQISLAGVCLAQRAVT